MHTYLLSDQDVKKYALEFVDRLQKLGDDVPKTWFALGRSGDKMLDEIIIAAEARHPQIVKGITIERLGCDRAKIPHRIFIRPAKEPSPDGIPLPERFKTETGLLIDGAIHSGASMRRTVEALWACGVSNIMSYSLVVKKTSEFIPSFFGLIIDEHDRAYFQMEILPNNRLKEGATRFGQLRRIDADDFKRQPNKLDTAVPSIDRVTFGDLWFEAATANCVVYVYEINKKIVGFLKFDASPGGIFHLDIVARDTSEKASDIGGLLLRWADTYARASKCTAIQLWGIERLLAYYNKIGYNEINGVEPIVIGDDEKYYAMRKPILYNIKPSMPGR